MPSGRGAGNRDEAKEMPTGAIRESQVDTNRGLLRYEYGA